MKKIILILSCFTLSGCVGSYVVFHEKDPQAFEDLHTVPERYKFPSHQSYTQEEMQLKTDHQKNLRQGNEERKKAQLLKETSSQAAPLSREVN